MSLYTNLLVVFITIAVVTLFPVLITPIILFAIYRQIIAQLAKILRPDFKGLVHHASSFWASDLERGNPKANIGACLVIDKPITLDDLIMAIGRSLMPENSEAQNSGKFGKIPYPELSKYPCAWMGLTFWKDEKDFQLRNHILEDSRPLTEAELPEVTTHALSDVPWPKESSPWRIILYSNLTGAGAGAAALVLSFHHSMGDAEGIGQVLKLINQRVNMSEPLPKISIAQVLQLPYTVLSNYIWSYDINDLHLPAKELSRKRKTVFLGKRIPFGGIVPSNIPPLGFPGVPEVTFRTSIILTGVAGALRRYMISRGQNIPPFLHFFQPLFLPRNGVQFKNCGSLAFHRLFTGIEDWDERLDQTIQFLHSSKNSVLPWTYHMTYKAIGIMPRSLQKVIVRSWQATGVYTEDHFPDKHYTATDQGARILEMHNFAGPMPGTSGIFVYVSIFKDEVGLRLSISESICKETKDVEKIMEDIVKEVKEIVKTLLI